MITRSLPGQQVRRVLIQLRPGLVQLWLALAISRNRIGNIIDSASYFPAQPG